MEHPRNPTFFSGPIEGKSLAVVFNKLSVQGLHHEVLDHRFKPRPAVKAPAFTM